MRQFFVETSIWHTSTSIESQFSMLFDRRHRQDWRQKTKPSGIVWVVGVSGGCFIINIKFPPKLIFFAWLVIGSKVESDSSPPKKLSWTNTRSHQNPHPSGWSYASTCKQWLARSSKVRRISRACDLTSRKAHEWLERVFCSSVLLKYNLTQPHHMKFWDCISLIWNYIFAKFRNLDECFWFGLLTFFSFPFDGGEGETEARNTCS